MAPDTDDTLLSITDAAAHMRVSTKTVRRYIAAGRLVGYRVGPTLIRLRREEVDALLRPIPSARRPMPAPPAPPRPRTRPTAAVLAGALRLTPFEHWLLHARGGHDGVVLEVLPVA